MAFIHECATAVPPYVFTQKELKEACRQSMTGVPELERYLPVFDHSGVERRHLSFPLDYYLAEHPFEKRNADFIEKAVDLCAQAGEQCLARAKIATSHIDNLFLVTTTGLATPSLDALLVPRLGLRSDIRRWPLFGLGCAGGAGALARAAQTPGVSLVISVELSGQTFTAHQFTTTDVVGASLFGDGACAVLVSSREQGKIRLVDSRSVLFPGTEDVMGWRFTSEGMRLVLSKQVPEVVAGPVRRQVAEFVGERKIKHWILHPGGRKVVETYRTAFGLGDRELQPLERSLQRYGNLSSAAVLFMLSELKAQSGETGLMVALGPGFCAELLLLEWV